MSHPVQSKFLTETGNITLGDDSTLVVGKGVVTVGGCASLDGDLVIEVELDEDGNIDPENQQLVRSLQILRSVLMTLDH